ncbi:YcnI family protein [Salinibacterium sp. SYSU T00001]|uniref:YcnI family copper-binding membrane protein n=1 Tax=Homoserinimonas sedimenticola TaxID=2986805 RepID=UPI002235ABDB|nr:YcnI family protein [Salinibacterium sedimenticola]MCW4384680.1 YcnI family protein [Salinibacterium sedimenticola]
MKNTTIAASTLGAAALLALLAPGAAFAHVTVSPGEAAAGSYAALEFAVGHGCEGSPTTALTFTLPEGVESVTPTINPGWTITEGEGTVTYTAITPLPDDRRDTFSLSVLLPEGEAGETLAFPVLQECETGQTDWSEVAEGDAEPEHPAPVLTLLESTGDTHEHGGAGSTEHGDAATDEQTDAAASDSTDGDDVLARALGLGGLVLGAIGIVLGLRRGTATR